MSGCVFGTFLIPVAILDYFSFFFIHLQHLDSEPVQTERPGELIAYYKIASKE
jgi:hypothetical protein